MTSVISSKRKVFLKWFNKIDKIVEAFHELPKSEKLFKGVRVNPYVDKKDRKATWFIGMNVLKIKVGRKFTSMYFNEVRKIIFSLDERIYPKKKKKIINILERICERGPN